jgi:hypothetical protein
MVADRDTMCIPAEILEHLVRTAERALRDSGEPLTKSLRPCSTVYSR